jgi:hypothetical protein
MQFIQLTESVGFPNRKNGDPFYNPSDEADRSTFVELILWPDGDVKAYETTDQRDQAFQSLESQVKGKIYKMNQPNAGALGLYIVHMLTSAGEDEYYVKFVKNVANNVGTTNIPPGVKAPGHGGYKFGSVSARKEAYAIKPSDIFKTEGPFNPADIPSKIAAGANIPVDLKDQMVGYLDAMSKGNKDYIIQGGNQYRTVHENYTGEFAAPMAVINAQIDNQDVRQKAETALLGGERFANCSIRFPLSSSQQLIDSELVASNGRVIGISSKAKTGGGAAASLAGLLQTINQKRSDQDFQKVLADHAEVVNLIEKVAGMSAVAGLIQVSLDQKIIDQQDASTLAEGITKAKQGTKTTLEELTPRLQKFIKNYAADTDNPRYNIIFHATAALSRVLAIKLKDMNVTDAVKDIMNFSTIIQVYAGASKVGEDLKLNSFKMIWPPNFSGQVVIDTAKNFTATEIRGKIGFKFK